MILRISLIFPSYKNHLTDLHVKFIEWFVYDRSIGYDWVYFLQSIRGHNWLIFFWGYFFLKIIHKEKPCILWLTIVSIHQLLSVSPAPSFSTTYVIMTSSLLVTLAGMVSDFATKSGGGDSVTSIRAYVL